MIGFVLRRAAIAVVLLWILSVITFAIYLKVPADPAGFLTAIGVAMYVETVLGLPGLGRTMIRALAGLQGYDLPVILAVTLVAAAIILLNLVADLVLLALDPTVARRGGRGLFRLVSRAT